MSRRKHAWDAFQYTQEQGGDTEHARHAVEGATVEDFTDRVYERWSTLESLVELNHDVKLGYELAIREFREALYESGWHDR